MLIYFDHFLAVDEDLAAARAVQPRRHVEEGRLAAARRADERDDFAVADRQGHPFDGRDSLAGALAIPKLLGDVAEFQPNVADISGYWVHAPSRAITAR
jgi:hypothetical protein